MKIQVVTIHGGETFDSYDDYLLHLKEQPVTLARLTQKDWKATLSQKLGEAFSVLSPEMPNKKNAKYLEWKIWFNKITPFLEENCIFVGHSLGGLFLTQYLSEERLKIKARALFIVASPSDRVRFNDSLSDFSLPKKVDVLRGQCEKVFLYYSKDDPVVPFSNAMGFQELFPEAELFVFEDRQHFNQNEFPELVEKIKSIM